MHTDPVKQCKKSFSRCMAFLACSNPHIQCSVSAPPVQLQQNTLLSHYL